MWHFGVHSDQSPPSCYRSLHVHLHTQLVHSLLDLRRPSLNVDTHSSQPLLPFITKPPRRTAPATMSGFFGFDSSLPERRPGQPPSGAGHGQQQRHGFGGFQPSNVDETFNLAGAGEEEDLAVYTWGEGMGGSLMEGGDDLNDETFGDLGDVGELMHRHLPRDDRGDPQLEIRECAQDCKLICVGNDFQFSAQPAPAAPPKSKIASTASRYKPKAVADPFAFSEDDFYSSRRAPASKSKQADPSCTLRRCLCCGSSRQNQLPSLRPSPRRRSPRPSPPLQHLRDRSRVSGPSQRHRDQCGAQRRVQVG